jgi:uncharacterized protein (UPF0210 family)
MKIRSITYFCNPGWPLQDRVLEAAGRFIKQARPAFETGGYAVQTTRLATVPFPRLVANQATSQAVLLAQALEDAVKSLGYDYVSIGPALASDPSSYPIIPEVLANTQDVFTAGMLSTPTEGISLPAARACAQVIHQAATITPDGFANLRFAALANVPPGSPFFPAAYASDLTPTFSLATEAADLAVESITQADSLADARHRLRGAVETHAQALSSSAEALADQFKLPFGGIDFSLAPFPEEALSVGTALERLGVPTVGMHGSLAAAAFLTDALDRARFTRAGFSGLFLPVLEDARLARRAAEGKLSVIDLLLYSAVCGTGLDTLPLAGDTTPEQLTPILLDLAALAQRLEKPLTARLMPIPGKVAGELTNFSFSYFANSRVLASEAAPLAGLLAGDEVFRLQRK